MQLGRNSPLAPSRDRAHAAERRGTGPLRIRRRAAAELPGLDGSPPHFKLSARELQILLAIVAGKSLTDIGAELFLSVKTVSTYRSRILDKLGLQSNPELVRYAMQHQLLD